jgi:hypothetical protein
VARNKWDLDEKEEKADKEFFSIALFLIVYRVHLATPDPIAWDRAARTRATNASIRRSCDAKYLRKL